MNLSQELFMPERSLSRMDSKKDLEIMISKSTADDEMSPLDKCPARTDSRIAGEILEEYPLDSDIHHREIESTELRDKSVDEECGITHL